MKCQTEFRILISAFEIGDQLFRKNFLGSRSLQKSQTAQNVKIVSCKNLDVLFRLQFSATIRVFPKCSFDFLVGSSKRKIVTFGHIFRPKLFPNFYGKHAPIKSCTVSGVLSGSESFKALNSSFNEIFRCFEANFLAKL